MARGDEIKAFLSLPADASTAELIATGVLRPLVEKNTLELGGLWESEEFAGEFLKLVRPVLAVVNSPTYEEEAATASLILTLAATHYEDCADDDMFTEGKRRLIDDVLEGGKSRFLEALPFQVQPLIEAVAKVTTVKRVITLVGIAVHVARIEESNTAWTTVAEVVEEILASDGVSELGLNDGIIKTFLPYFILGILSEFKLLIMFLMPLMLPVFCKLPGVMGAVILACQCVKKDCAEILKYKDLNVEAIVLGVNNLIRGLMEKAEEEKYNNNDGELQQEE